MKNVLFLFIFGSIINCNAQKKKNWYFTGEIGINSYTTDQSYINFGVGVEHFFTERFSLLIKMKYFDSVIDHDSTQKNASCTTGFCFNFRSNFKLFYRQKSLILPINLKLEEQYGSKISFYVAAGPALNIILSEQFIEVVDTTPILSNNIEINANAAIGATFTIHKNIQLFIDQSLIFLAKAKVNNSTGFLNLAPTNTDFFATSIGIRYKL